jgi:hypothetical protein
MKAAVPDLVAVAAAVAVAVVVAAELAPARGPVDCSPNSVTNRHLRIP